MTTPRIFLPSIGDKISDYTIEGKLGEGSFGNVYMVRDSKGAIKALKLLKLWTIIDPQEADLIVKRFRLEYETGLIESDFLVGSEGYGFVEGNPYIVMEYCPKGDLRPFVTGETPVKYVKSKAIEMLRGLRDLHANGKIHRDLKPENVLLDSEGIAKLTDFGISGHKNERLTIRDFFGNPMQIFGTYAYLPPEQLQRVKDTKLFTLDIFSFGVVIYELLTGNLPFGELKSQNDLAEYKLNASRGNIQPISRFRSDVSPDLESIVLKCLSPNPKNRFQTSGEVLQLFGQSDIVVSSQNSIRLSPSLEVMFGADNGQLIDLKKLVREKRSGVLSLGRNAEAWSNDIYIREMDDVLITKFISRKHATIEEHDSNWVLRDGQWDNTFSIWKRSLNGTFVNSAEIDDEGIILKPGDIIIMGDTTLKFN